MRFEPCTGFHTHSCAQQHRSRGLLNSEVVWHSKKGSGMPPNNQEHYPTPRPTDVHSDVIFRATQVQNRIWRRARERVFVEVRSRWTAISRTQRKSVQHGALAAIHGRTKQGVLHKLTRHKSRPEDNARIAMSLGSYVLRGRHNVWETPADDEQP